MTSNQRPASRARPFIIPIFLPHAGCPHRCVFCNQVSISGKAQEAVPPDVTRGQIREFLKYKTESRKPAQIAFFGGNFLGLKPEEIRFWLALADEFISRGLVDGIRFSTRPDTIDARRLDILDNYPVSIVELGVQSMDDDVLALAERGHTASDTLRAVKALKRRRLGIGLQMMVGLPGDSDARSLVTARKIADLEPDCARVYPTVVVENSRLAHWFKKGEYQPLSLEAAVRLVKKVYLIFQREGIAVIPMGPYHPAFGHMVHSEIFYDKVAAAIESAGSTTGALSILVNPRSISKMRGLSNSNIKKLKKQFGFYSVDVLPDNSLTEEEVGIG